MLTVFTEHFDRQGSDLFNARLQYILPLWRASLMVIDSELLHAATAWSGFGTDNTFQPRTISQISTSTYLTLPSCKKYSGVAALNDRP